MYDQTICKIKFDHNLGKVFVPGFVEILPKKAKFCRLLDAFSAHFSLSHLNLGVSEFSFTNYCLKNKYLSDCVSQ